MLQHRVWLDQERKLGHRPPVYPARHKGYTSSLKKDKKEKKQKKSRKDYEEYVWPHIHTQPWLFQMKIEHYVVCGHVVYIIFDVDGFSVLLVSQ